MPGELYPVDIGIPPGVYHRVGVPFIWLFAERYWLQLGRESGVESKCMAPG